MGRYHRDVLSAVLFIYFAIHAILLSNLSQVHWEAKPEYVLFPGKTGEVRRLLPTLDALGGNQHTLTFNHDHLTLVLNARSDEFLECQPFLSIFYDDGFRVFFHKLALLRCFLRVVGDSTTYLLSSWKEPSAALEQHEKPADKH